MEKKKIYLIAIVKLDDSTEAYRVYIPGLKEAKNRQINYTTQTAEKLSKITQNPNYNCVNFEYKDGKIVSTNGINKRYAQLNSKGQLIVPIAPMVILYEVEGLGYSVIDYKGTVVNMNYAQAIAYAQNPNGGIANGYVKEVDGKNIISAIEGTYEIIKPIKKVKNTLPKVEENKEKEEKAIKENEPEKEERKMLTEKELNALAAFSLQSGNSNAYDSYGNVIPQEMIDKYWKISSYNNNEYKLSFKILPEYLGNGSNNFEENIGEIPIMYKGCFITNMSECFKDFKGSKIPKFQAVKVKNFAKFAYHSFITQIDIPENLNADTCEEMFSQCFDASYTKVSNVTIKAKKVDKMFSETDISLENIEFITNSANEVFYNNFDKEDTKNISFKSYDENTEGVKMVDAFANNYYKKNIKGISAKTDTSQNSIFNKCNYDNENIKIEFKNL